jgi:hypothetical protein
MVVKDFIDIKNYPLWTSENRIGGHREIGWYHCHRTRLKEFVKLVVLCVSCASCGRLDELYFVLHIVTHRLTIAESDDKCYCDCSKYCKRRKQVSSATWYNYTEHRGAVMMTFAFASADTSSSIDILSRVNSKSLPTSTANK